MSSADAAEAAKLAEYQAMMSDTSSVGQLPPLAGPSSSRRRILVKKRTSSGTAEDESPTRRRVRVFRKDESDDSLPPIADARYVPETLLLSNASPARTRLRSTAFGLEDDFEPSPSAFSASQTLNMSTKSQLQQLHQQQQQQHRPSSATQSSTMKLSTLAKDHLQTARRMEETEKTKRLSKMAIPDRMDATRDERALQLWQERQQEWSRIKKNVAKKVGRTEDELQMDRVEHFRVRKEEIDHFEDSVPEHVKRGTVPWESTLRQGAEGDLAGERLVQFGVVRYPYPIFAVVKTAGPGKETETVRVPRKAMGEKPAEAKSVYEGSEYYKQKEKEFRKYLTKHQPQADELAVVGRGLFSDDALAKIDRGLESTAEIEVFAEHADEPEFDAAAAAEAQAKADADAGLRTGPHCVFSGTSLHMQSEIKSSAQASFMVRNTGTCAIFYEWRAVAPPSKFIPAPASSLNDSPFFFPDREGSILPGDEHEFVFTFESPRPGVFSEYWQFFCVPVLQEHPEHFVVCLQGHAVSYDRNPFAVAEFQHRLAQITEQVAAAARDEALARSLPIPQDAEEHEDEGMLLARMLAERQAKFESENAVYPLAYQEHVFAALERIYATTCTLLADESEADLPDGEWNTNVHELKELIMFVPDAMVRADLLAYVDKLIRARHASALSTAVHEGEVAEAWGQLADDIDAASTRVKIAVGLEQPPQPPQPVQTAAPAKGAAPAKKPGAKDAPPPVPEGPDMSNPEVRAAAEAKYTAELNRFVRDRLGLLADAIEVRCEEVDAIASRVRNVGLRE